MSEIRTLNRKRSVYRAAFTKTVTSLQTWLEAEEKDFDAIQGDYALLEEKANLINDLNQEIFQHFVENEATEEDLVKEVEMADTYKRKFHTLASAVSAVLARGKEYQHEAQSTVSSSCHSSSKYRLPKIEFRKFSGSLRDWLGFWNQFQKIDEDVDLNNADKYEYLIQATLPNSKARDIVDSFPATSENYPKAIQKLKSRFGKDSLLVEVYTRELLSMMNSCVGLDISSLYDRLETQLSALESLGVTSEKYAAMLFPMIESCLSVDVLRAWQRSGGGKESEPGERLRGLMKFLENEVEGEERIKLAVHKTSRPKDYISVGPHTLKDWLKLREEHRIVGALVGCLAHLPRQESFPGLPMALLPEEATLLLEKNVVKIARFPSLSRAPGPGVGEEFQKYRNQIYEEQKKYFMEERKRQVTNALDQIIEGKRRKLLGLKTLKKREVRKAGKSTSSDKETSIVVPELECVLDKEALLEEELQKITPVSFVNTLVQTFTAYPWLRPEDACDVKWKFPSNPEEKLRYMIFKDIWEKGFYLTSGQKFGCDFLAYPGDPVKFHAQYLVICIENDCNLTPTQLVAYGRLGTSVRKTVLLASKSIKGNKIIYQSLKWCGAP